MFQPRHLCRKVSESEPPVLSLLTIAERSFKLRSSTEVNWFWSHESDSKIPAMSVPPSTQPQNLSLSFSVADSLSEPEKKIGAHAKRLNAGDRTELAEFLLRSSSLARPTLSPYALQFYICSNQIKSSDYREKSTILGICGNHVIAELTR
ncbi:hypothetical protein U1Q18_007875 [Sarracenia purpurea var. burkii]